MKQKTNKRDNKPGRPSKAEPPKIPYEEVDKLLVFGELVPTKDGTSATVVYPTYRQIASRYGVAHSLIAAYSQSHNCKRRRKETNTRISVKAEQKLIESRATAIAVTKEDTLRVIDTFILDFENAIHEGRVRVDNPTDFNTMVRLKEFIQGGADSRQELHTSLSLEDLQARHKQMLRIIEESSAAERGEVGGHEPARIQANNTSDELEPPIISSINEQQKMNVHFLGNGIPSQKAAPKSRETAARLPNDQSGDDSSSNERTGNTGARGAKHGKDSYDDDDLPDISYDDDEEDE
ncbi:MAG: hypothetical protein JXA30_11405 [Deltaproteobacteria bacterium]|nr:hypothetical protein [Deltaproteobacteria bacterium]